VLASVLFNAAAGASFDQLLAAVAGPPWQAAGAILTLLRGTGQDMAGLSVTRATRYMRVLTHAVIANLRCPIGPVRAALAMVQSPDSAALLRVMRERRIPTLVLHGDNDSIVPYQSACDIAAEAGGSLYRLPGACHSWMIADPGQGADELRHLISGELGDALYYAAQALGITDWRNSAQWERVLTAPKALIHQLNKQRHTNGADHTQHVMRERVNAHDLRRNHVPAGDRNSVVRLHRRGGTPTSAPGATACLPRR
jgi:hypothetical protein